MGTDVMTDDDAEQLRSRLDQAFRRLERRELQLYEAAERCLEQRRRLSERFGPGLALDASRLGPAATRAAKLHREAGLLAEAWVEAKADRERAESDVREAKRRLRRKLKED
jgi:hypothetical protein